MFVDYEKGIADLIFYNVARRDIADFLQLTEIPIKAEVEEFALEDANRALVKFKERRIRGSKVLRID
jgi:propanol-preferring alcohol dehydrogenase